MINCALVLAFALPWFLPFEHKINTGEAKNSTLSYVSQSYRVSTTMTGNCITDVVIKRKANNQISCFVCQTPVLCPSWLAVGWLVG